ncbi:hypothetical protein Lsed01_00827 [Demequina sediminis]|uniref:DUF4760 domain-containing protein n=1 Tax=Demequina sediminis TaxID=1930058 RepID=A0ABP9WIE2_9MICO|nr:hypothetical protein [Demequina sediminis]BDZ62519.1 hypothetical protein GCM10025873_23100 [Demequina sediminis]
MRALKAWARTFGRTLKRTWGYVLLVLVEAAVIAFTFAYFDDPADAASVSVSAGFLLVTVLYVISTQRMAKASEETLRLERSRDDRVRLAALQENLKAASTGALRAWIYFAEDFRVLIADDIEVDDDGISKEEGFFLAADGVSVVRRAHSEILRNVAMLRRCGLGNEAADFVESVPPFSDAIGMYAAMNQRSARPNDKDERRAWERECWLHEREMKGLPPWEDVVDGKVHHSVQQALTGLNSGIDHYWARQ